MTDSYLPGICASFEEQGLNANEDSHVGAMVLAHSLRDNGTQKQLAALVTLDSISASTIETLKVESTDGRAARFSNAEALRLCTTT